MIAGCNRRLQRAGETSWSCLQRNRSRVSEMESFPTTQDANHLKLNDKDIFILCSIIHIYMCIDHGLYLYICNRLYTVTSTTFFISIQNHSRWRRQSIPFFTQVNSTLVRYISTKPIEGKFTLVMYMSNRGWTFLCVCIY